MPARHETSPLQRFSRRDILHSAAGGGNAAELVAKALEFLNEKGAETAPAEGFGNFHVDVAVRAVVMEEDSAKAGALALEFDHAMRGELVGGDAIEGVVFSRGAEGCARRGEMAGDAVVEQDAFAGDVASEGMKHDGEERIVGLGFDAVDFGDGGERAEEIEDVVAGRREDEEFKDGGLIFPRAADRNRTVADRSGIDGEDVFFCPAGAGVKGMVDDLAVHFVAINAAPACNRFDRNFFGPEDHEKSLLTPGHKDEAFTGWHYARAAPKPI